MFDFSGLAVARVRLLREAATRLKEKRIVVGWWFLDL